VKRAALGFRVHSGWAALIALTVTKGVPVVLFRERIHLVENFTYKFRQPYHTAKKLPLEEARAFVARVRSEARRLAHRAIRELTTELRDQGYFLTGFGLLLSSGRPLPAFAKILAAHSLIHSADGELFREALLHAAARSGLKPVTIRERDLPDSASRALRRKPADLAQRISDLGRSLGPPWSQDEKFAALVAWLAASSRPSPSHSPQAREAR
jgi:hypothetical protein